MQMLGKASLVNEAGNKRFLLDKTQHQIGGFSKLEHNPPGTKSIDEHQILANVADILHSSLGLAALSLLHQADVKSLDPMLAIRQEARDRLESIRSEYTPISADQY